jgi:ATP/maltotriose-dependent transcriptional regulator MalT
MEQHYWMRPSLEKQLEELKTRVSAGVLARAAQNARGLSIKLVGWALLDELADQDDRQPVVALSHRADALSERELEVLRLAADGLSNREIAVRLVVTVGTVKKHLNNIFGKLGVERRTQAIERARELQLIP